MAKNILLVEDDPLLIDIYTTKFKEAGFLMEVESDGQKVADLVEQKRPDLVILDIVLPHLDGWAILEDLKTKKLLKSSKVMILSNLGQKEEIEKGLALGAARYLVKAHYTPTQVVQEASSLLRA